MRPAGFVDTPHRPPLCQSHEMRAPLSLAAARCRQSENSHAKAQPSGVNGLSAIQHNRALFEVGAFTALLAWWVNRYAALRALSGSHNERLCLAPRPSAARTVLPCVLNSQSVCSRQQPRQHIRLARRCAPVCMSHAPARPAVAGARLALRCSFPRARARSRPPPCPLPSAPAGGSP